MSSHLSSQDLTSAIRVNHQWFEWFTPALWKRVVEFSFRPTAPPKPSDVGFKEGLAKYGHRLLQSLTISTEHRLEAYLEYCHHLLDLRLFFPYDLKQPASPDRLNRLIALNPSLRSMAITIPLFVIEHACFSSLTLLTTLYLNRTFVNVHELARILAYTPHLSTLGFREVVFGPRLDYREEIDDEAFTALLLAHLVESNVLESSHASTSPSPMSGPGPEAGQTPTSSSPSATTATTTAAATIQSLLPWKEYPRLRELSFWTPMEALDLWLLGRLLEQAPNLTSLSFCLGQEYGLFPSVCQRLQDNVHQLQQLTLAASSPPWVDPLAAAAAAAMVAACRAKPIGSLSLHDYVNATTTTLGVGGGGRGTGHHDHFYQCNNNNNNSLVSAVAGTATATATAQTSVQIQMEMFAPTLQYVRLYNFQEREGAWFPRLVRDCRRLRVLDMRFPMSMVPFKEIAMATWNCHGLRKLDLVIGFDSLSKGLGLSGEGMGGDGRDEDERGAGEEGEVSVDLAKLERLGGYHHRRQYREMDLAVLERLFFEKLATLTQLQGLNLKGPRGYRGKYTDDHLELTLESGLGLLKDLSDMREFRVVSMNHRMGAEEREWMKIHWPLLRVCEIWPNAS
ncbi:hypothetical protein BGZ73_009244 [Actinomortierella ambigua]|nr:hypothetical protein BGZ73_009244 [Actinomortierella ambigua]